MAKISLDVEEIKKNLRDRAVTTTAQLTELAKKAQKDLSENEIVKSSQKELLKKVDQLTEIVKSQEFMKNPKVAELAKKLITITEQIEKTVTKNVAPFVEEVRARVQKTTDNVKTVANQAAEKANKAAETTSMAADAVKNAANGVASTVKNAVNKAESKTGSKKTTKKSDSSDD